jgi:hypothetical protein
MTDMIPSIVMEFASLCFLNVVSFAGANLDNLIVLIVLSGNACMANPAMAAGHLLTMALLFVIYIVIGV